MKKIVILFLCIPLMLAGCAKATSTPPPTAPGYANSTDQTMGSSLAAAHAFYQTLQQDVASGKFVPSQGEKTALNALAASLNVAQPLYLAYHTGTVTQAQAQAAVTDVINKQTALQSQIGAK